MATFTVSTTTDIVDPNDGVLSLREAVAQANATTAADTIVFAGSIEGQTLTLTGGELTVTRNLIIDGDRNGDGVAVTLDGNENDRTLVIQRSDDGAFSTDVQLTSLGLTNGLAGRDEDGGAIHFSGGGHLSILNCAIADNQAGVFDYGAAGGGIFTTGGKLTVVNSRIEGNAALGGSEFGGGIAAFETKLAIVKCELAGNFAGYGGAVAVSGGDLMIQGTNIHDNSAFVRYYPGSGGGVHSVEATATIMNSVVSDNQSITGGGIYARGRLSILDSTIASNEAPYDDDGYSGAGGGVFSRGDIVIRNSTITGNIAEG